MLQLDTRPSAWTSSSTFHADGSSSSSSSSRSLPEFSLSTLQNSGVFSRLSTRNSLPTLSTPPQGSSDSMSDLAAAAAAAAAASHGDVCSSSSYSSSSYPPVSSLHDRQSSTRSTSSVITATGDGEIIAAHGRRPLKEHEQDELIISRSPHNRPNSSSLEREASAKPVQPTTQKPATPLSLDATLNLPPIRLASSVRASSSPSSSPSPSPSLLPSISEPQLPSLRGRVLSSPPTAAVSPTDNTCPAGTKRCQSASCSRSSSSSSSRSRSRSRSHSPASLPESGLINPAAGVPSSSYSSSSSSLPQLLSSDRIGIDNDAVAAAVDRRLPPLLVSGTSTTADESADGRTSRKRNLEEYQGNSDPFPPRRAPASIVHPLSQSLSADSIPNPSTSGLPGSLPPTDSISVPERQPSRSPPNPSVKPVPLRLHEGDLPNRTDVDNSVESTIVLAHRAVTAIKNQSFPRSKTIGPTFTIGKQGSQPFGVTGRSHDGVMESEDESDTGSSTTTSSPPNKPRMMPWDRRKAIRDDSPCLDRDFPEDLDPSPIRGPIQRPDSSPKCGPRQLGLGPLIRGMGGCTDRASGVAEDVRTGLPLEPAESDTSSSQSPEEQPSGGAVENPKDSNGQEAPSATTTNTVPKTISPISRPGDGNPGDGDGDEDPNDKRSRKLSEHEQDNGNDSVGSDRAKRRKLSGLEDGVPAEPHVPGKADQDAAVSGPFGLSKGHSPPPVPSGPPTVESVPSTAATLGSGHPYSEIGTPATICEMSDYNNKSPVETTSNNILPPIHSPPSFSPGRPPMSPRTTHTTLPSVNSLFTVASAAEKHSIDHQQIQPNHNPNGGTFSNPVLVQRLNVGASTVSNTNPPPNPRIYVDSISRAIPFKDPAQQYKTVAPRSRQSPTVSPIEGRNAPIAPAPANGFAGQASTSPLNQFTPMPTYYPPKNLNRPEHHATLPPLQTDWPGSLPPSEQGSARTPTSKKRGRNGTPKNGSIDSSQNSPTIAGGFRCDKEGCTAAPFSTQYLLNSHANVHSEDRPHFCPVAGCSRGEGGKGFKRKNEMIRHGLVHQSPGYVCPFCPDKEHRYPRPDNLQRHVKAHHKDKSGDDPLLREVLAVRPEGGQRGRRRRLGPNP
ncbi:hypothetical protein TWF281_011286 [Arthrobotrys megalospora]